MNQEETKHVALLKVLKEDKQAQRSALRLGKTEDWNVLRLFMVKVKQEFLEASMSAGDMDTLKRYRNVVEAMEGIINLPEFVNSIKKEAKEDTASKEEEKEEAKRRKFNPGGFVRKIIKGGVS